MRYVRWGFWITLFAVIFGFLHYTLPQRDIVRIVGTENRRVDIGANAMFWGSSDAGMVNSTSRDVYFINAVYPDGHSIEFRNEDTGWGWPPYLKVNSSNVQTQAKELESKASDPVWVAVKHYGWYNNFFSIFPNVTSLKRVAGPDVTLIPWGNIVILTALFAAVIWLRVMWLRFREKMLDPAIDHLDARGDLIQAKTRGFWHRLRAKFSGK